MARDDRGAQPQAGPTPAAACGRPGRRAGETPGRLFFFPARRGAAATLVAALAPGQRERLYAAGALRGRTGGRPPIRTSTRCCAAGSSTSGRNARATRARPGAWRSPRWRPNPAELAGAPPSRCLRHPHRPANRWTRKPRGPNFTSRSNTSPPPRLRPRRPMHVSPQPCGASPSSVPDLQATGSRRRDLHRRHDFQNKNPMNGPPPIQK